MLLTNGNNDEKVLREADFALQQISIIKKEAQLLIQDSKNYLNNKSIDDSFLKSIKKIQNICQRIEREHKSRKYSNCFNLISKDLLKSFCEFDTELKSFFEEPFNWEEE